MSIERNGATHRRCFSFGIHLDWKWKYVDIHFMWWIITFGIGNYQVAHYCNPESAAKVDALFDSYKKECERIYREDKEFTPMLR